MNKMKTDRDEADIALFRAVLKPHENALLVVSPQVKPADNKAVRRAICGALLLVLLCGGVLCVDSLRWVVSLMLLPLWVLALVWLSAPQRARARTARTLCLLTNHRALVLQPTAMGYRCVTWPLYEGVVTEVKQVADGSGSILFDRSMHQHYPASLRRSLPGGFEAVPQVERVLRLIAEQVAMANREHETETELLFPQRGTVTALDAEGNFLKDYADTPKEYSASPGIVLGSCFALLASLFIWCVLPSLRMDMRLEAEGVSARGTVVRVESSLSSDKTLSYFPVVHFTPADGVVREFRSSYGCSATEYPVGSKVELRYLPTDPTQVRLVGERGVTVLILLFSAAFFWLGVIMAGRGVILYWRRRYYHESF